MALKIIDDCMAWDCEPDCPNSAISEEIDIYVIDPAHYTECYGVHQTQQCADVRPAESCVQDDDHLGSPEELWGQFKRLYPDRQPANTDIWNAPVL